jgi:hypothetical protein
MHRVSEDHRLIGRKLVQQIFVFALMKAACFAGSSLREIAFGLRCSMPRRCNSAISPDRVSIFDAAFTTRSTRQLHGSVRGRVSADPGFQLVLLLHRQPAAAPFMAEACQTLDPVLLIELVPGPDRVVVDQQNFRRPTSTTHAIGPAAPAHSRAAPIGCAADPSRASSIRSQRDSLSRNPGRIMQEAASPRARLARGFSGIP